LGTDEAYKRTQQQSDDEQSHDTTPLHSSFLTHNRAHGFGAEPCISVGTYRTERGEHLFLAVFTRSISNNSVRRVKGYREASSSTIRGSNSCAYPILHVLARSDGHNANTRVFFYYGTVFSARTHTLRIETTFEKEITLTWPVPNDNQRSMLH
jgi:hypothetical protein